MRFSIVIVLVSAITGWTLLAAAQTPQLGLPDAKGMGTPYDADTPGTLVHHHGDYLDGKHRFIIDEEDGFATIRLVKKERAPGGPHLYYDPKTGQDDSVIRFEAESELLRIRSEVLVIAAPNYIKNPGDRYRITIEGLAVAPDYKKVFEVDAYEALDAIYAEAVKMAAETEGIEREAIFYGLMVAMQVLNEDQRLPARIPLTVLRSEAGQRRIQGETLSRGEQPRLERFESVAEGQRGMKAQIEGGTGVLQVAPEAVQGPGYRRGRPETVERGAATKPNKYRTTRQDLTPPDPREQRLRGMRDPQPKSERIGMRGEPLTVPQHAYGPVDAANFEKMDLIMGGKVESPLTMKGKR